jgi:hypothetical protein
MLTLRLTIDKSRFHVDFKFHSARHIFPKRKCQRRQDPYLPLRPPDVDSLWGLPVFIQSVIHPASAQYRNPRYFAGDLSSAISSTAPSKDSSRMSFAFCHYLPLFSFLFHFYFLFLYYNTCEQVECIMGVVVAI